MLILYIIVLGLGIVSSFSDIKFKKIKNFHLLLAVASGLLAYTYLLFTHQLTANINLIWNILIGMGIAMSLFWIDIWRAGDAKLFTVYCLLIPTGKHPSLFFFPSIALFANIFIASTLVILLLSIKEIMQDRKRILHRIYSFHTLATLGKSFLSLFALQWLIQTIMNRLMPRTSHLFLIFLLFLSYRLIMWAIKKFQSNFILFLLFGAGLAFRLLLNPADFNIPGMLPYLKRIFFYTFLFYSISIIFELNESNEKQKKIIPFAPFMFLGALLTNTNFLNLAIHILENIKKI